MTTGPDDEALTPQQWAAVEAWEQRVAEVLEASYVARGAGPRGSGSNSASEGDWRAKRQHLAVPMDRSGDWLDVGCANGHLLATLPGWAAERDLEITPHGLELLPRVAELARSLHPELAERIWTGSVLRWSPPRPFHYVTALADSTPPQLLNHLVTRLLGRFVEPGGRLILSSYTSAGQEPQPFVEDLTAAGFTPDGVIRIERPGRFPLQTVWLDRSRT